MVAAEDVVPEGRSEVAPGREGSDGRDEERRGHESAATNRLQEADLAAEDAHLKRSAPSQPVLPWQRRRARELAPVSRMLAGHRRAIPIHGVDARDISPNRRPQMAPSARAVSPRFHSPFCGKPPGGGVRCRGTPVAVVDGNVAHDEQSEPVPKPSNLTRMHDLVSCGFRITIVDATPRHTIDDQRARELIEAGAFSGPAGTPAISLFWKPRARGGSSSQTTPYRQARWLRLAGSPAPPSWLLMECGTLLAGIARASARVQARCRRAGAARRHITGCPRTACSMSAPGAVALRGRMLSRGRDRHGRRRATRNGHRETLRPRGGPAASQRER